MHNLDAFLARGLYQLHGVLQHVGPAYTGWISRHQSTDVMTSCRNQHVSTSQRLCDTTYASMTGLTASCRTPPGLVNLHSQKGVSCSAANSIYAGYWTWLCKELTRFGTQSAPGLCVLGQLP